jgi:hypothetical protein
MHMLITKQLCLPLCSCKPFLHELMVVDAKLDENKVSDHASWPRTKVSDACHAAGTGRCRWRGNAKARAAAGQLAGRIWHCSNLRSHAVPVREMAQLLLPPVQRSWTASMHPCEFPVKLHQNSCHHKKEESLWFFLVGLSGDSWSSYRSSSSCSSSPPPTFWQAAPLTLPACHPWSRQGARSTVTHHRFSVVMSPLPRQPKH